MYPDDLVTLPDPAGRPNTRLALRTHLSEIYGPYREVLHGLQNYVGKSTAPAVGSLTARIAALEAGGAGDPFYTVNLVDDFGADPTGAVASDAALAAAGAHLRSLVPESGELPAGTTLVIPRGWFNHALEWDLSGLKGLTVLGLGTMTPDHLHGASVLNYTGTGRHGINCGSAHGVVFSGVQASFDNPAFAGVLVEMGRYRRRVASATTTEGSLVVTSADAKATDAGRVLSGTGIVGGGARVNTVEPGVSWTLYLPATASGTQTDIDVLGDDGAYNWWINGNLKGVGTRGGTDGQGGTGALFGDISRLIGFGGAIFSGIDRVHLSSAARGVEGTFAGDPERTIYSNVVTVARSIFNYMSHGAIANPGMSWTMTENTFEAFQGAGVTGLDDSPAVFSDESIARSRSSSCKYTGNWHGDGCPDYWLNLYASHGWEISGNYVAKFASPTNPYRLTPYIKLRLASGIHIAGNEFTVEVTDASLVHPPVFDGSSDFALGEVDGAVRGVVFAGNKVKSGSSPTNIAGLSDIAIFANDWPVSVTAPGNGWYFTDSSATVIATGGGGSHPDLAAHDTLGLATQAELEAHAATPHVTAGQTHMSARDYFVGTGAAETVAAINSFKAAMDGKITHWPVATDYNFANILASNVGADGTPAFQFTKPTIWRGPGLGNDQVVGGITVGRLIFPAGVRALHVIGNGNQGGATNSKLEDLFIKGPLGAWEAIDGIRIEAGSFTGINVLIEGFGRDNWSIDTDNNTNANNSLLLGCKSYYSRRHGLYLAGTNSNVFGLQNFDVNNSGSEAGITAAVTLPTSPATFTLTFPAGFTSKLPTAGRGTLKFSATQTGFVAWSGKTATTLTGCVAPGAVNGVVVPSGSIFAYGFGIWQGGTGERTVQVQNGGFTNTATACHGSFNAEGFICDESGGNTYNTCYCEDTRAQGGGGPHQWRMVLAPDAHSGIVLGIWFGGFPVYFQNTDGMVNVRSSESLLTASQQSWLIRNPTLFGMAAEHSGRAVVSGAKGGNAALASVVGFLAAQGLARDTTT